MRHSNCSIVLLLSLALVYGIVRLVALNTRSDSALIAIAERTSIAIFDSAGYMRLCDDSSHQLRGGVSIDSAGAVIKRSNSS